MHSDWQEFGSGYWASGQQAELCGELIDTNHKLILSLAQTFKLTTVGLLQAQPNGTTDTYYVNGAVYSYAQASSDFQPVHNTLQSQVQATGYPAQYNSYTAAGQAFDRMTVHDWINTYVPGDLSSNMGALLNAAYNEEYGAETTGQSSLNLIYLLGYNAKPGNWAVYGKSGSARLLPERDRGQHRRHGDADLRQRQVRHRQLRDPLPAVRGAAHDRLLQGWLRRAELPET